MEPDGPLRGAAALSASAPVRPGSGVAVRVGGPTFNERRNTSRVFPVPPYALKQLQAALAALRRNDPELVRWIEDGHPTLTRAEHFERFGCDYRKAARK